MEWIASVIDWDELVLGLVGRGLFRLQIVSGVEDPLGKKCRGSSLLCPSCTWLVTIEKENQKLFYAIFKCVNCNLVECWAVLFLSDCACWMGNLYVEDMSCRTVSIMLLWGPRGFGICLIIIWFQAKEESTTSLMCKNANKTRFLH